MCVCEREGGERERERERERLWEGYMDDGCIFFTLQVCVYPCSYSLVYLNTPYLVLGFCS